MKLLHEIIIRRLDVAKDFDLNNEYFKSIWGFYEVYKLCLNFLGITDDKLILKQKFLRNFIMNPDKVILLDKLKRYISEDSNIIEVALNSIRETEDVNEIYEDFYPVSIFAVNLDDRGN